MRYKYDKTGNLHNKIITYAYEELLLDPAKKYKISYFKNSDDSYMIYVIDVQKALNNINQNLQKSLKNINIIIPSPLLMSGFYAGRLLNKSGVDCYIFFDENESYVSFYKDGEYIFFHLIISDTLASIARQNNIEYKAEIIDQNIDKFNQLIDATIQTIQSIINIDRITPDRVFLSSFIGDLKGLSLTISKALNKSINGFDFLAKFGSFTPINLMLAIYVKELLYRDNGLNFILLDKPEPLYKRADGKLFISLAAGVILGIIYPIYMLILAFSLDMNSKDFGVNLSLQNSNADNLNKNLMIINKEIEKIDKDIQIEFFLSKEQFINNDIERDELLSNNCFVVMIENIPVGYIETSPISNGNISLSIGIEKTFRGNGYGTLILSGLTDNLLCRDDIDRVSAIISPKNNVSIRLFEKCGFERSEDVPNCFIKTKAYKLKY